MWGTLYVLRKGFEDINATFRMVQFAPANQQNPATWGLYQKNKLRVVRQLHYSLHNRKDVADNNFPNFLLRIWARYVVASRLFGSPNCAPCA